MICACDWTEAVSMDVFSPETSDELESYAQTGTLPEWFESKFGAVD